MLKREIDKYIKNYYETTRNALRGCVKMHDAVNKRLCHGERSRTICL